jgi:hypothetical protein
MSKTLYRREPEKTKPKAKPKKAHKPKKKQDLGKTIALMSLVLIVLMLAFSIIATRLIIPILVLGFIYYVCSKGRNPKELLK